MAIKRVEKRSRSWGDMAPIGAPSNKGIYHILVVSVALFLRYGSDQFINPTNYVLYHEVESS